MMYINVIWKYKIYRNAEKIAVYCVSKIKESEIRKQAGKYLIDSSPSFFVTVIVVFVFLVRSIKILHFYIPEKQLMN